MNAKHTVALSIVLVAAIFLSSCTAGDPMYAADSPAGFWSGVWHGMISWFTLVLRLFGADVAVYEVANNGGWYDWGFLLGAGGSSCSCAGGASRRRRRSEISSE